MIRPLALVCAPLATATLLAAPVLADTQDNQYLGAVAALGITADPQGLIAGAHTMCDGLGTVGFSWMAAEGQVVGAGVPAGQATPVLIAAGRAYCPDKLHAIGLS